MSVRAVLWDADGVLQAGPPSWDAAFAEVLGDAAGPVNDACCAELDDALAGRFDMSERIDQVLAAHGVTHRRDEVREIWRRIEPRPETRAVIAALAVPSYLATNQDSWRTTCMRADLGYDDLLAGSFYSCEIGVAKPAAAFFEHIVDALGLAPAELLFIDDLDENVEAARDAGLRAEIWHHDEGVDELCRLLVAHGLTVRSPAR